VTGDLWRKYCFPNSPPVPCPPSPVCPRQPLPCPGSSLHPFVASRITQKEPHMIAGSHRGSREPPGQPKLDAGAHRRESPRPSSGLAAGREGPGVIMMPGPFSWSTGPLHRATPETATHHVHATGPINGSPVRQTAFNRTGHCRFTLPTTVFRAPEAQTARTLPNTCERIRTPGPVYLYLAKPPKAQQPASGGCTLPAPERGGAMYFGGAKTRRSVRTSQHWRTVIASS
jgi:hypothetical protein